jgi:uncharacterized protein YfkK (UPF0435 family)
MAADQITYSDKVKYQDVDLPSNQQWRAIDCNEVKETVNQHATEIDNKVDKVSGKGLSTNDYSNTDAQKVSDILDYIEITLVDNSGVSIYQIAKSSGVDDVTLTNPIPGEIQIDCVSVVSKKTVCIVTLTDYDNYLVNVSNGQINIGLKSESNTPFDGGSISIKLIP